MSIHLGERYEAEDEEIEAPAPPPQKGNAEPQPKPVATEESGEMEGTWGSVSEERGTEEPGGPLNYESPPRRSAFTGHAHIRSSNEPSGPAVRVVFVPGIMGSRLAERTTGVPVWGDVRMLAAFASLETLVAWRLVIGSGNGINDGGLVIPRGLLNLPFIDPYSAIVADLNRMFGPANVLVFPYDWRLANEHNAILLQAAIRARWPNAESGSAGRVHIIAHSMGGLVSRWLIERLGGTRLVQSLITVGTPHFGAPEALTLLSATTFGFVPGHAALSSVPVIGPVMHEIARLAGRFGSVAQLLPGFDFFIPLGAVSPESISATFGRIRSSLLWAPIFGGSILRGPASSSIRNLNRVLIGGVPSLNSTLASTGVRYFHIATTNKQTVVQARELAGPAIFPVPAPCGDGTVPGSSAVLPASSNIIPLFRTSSLEHSNLFNDPAIRALCTSLVSGSVPAPTPAPECAGPAPRTGLEGSFGEGNRDSAAIPLAGSLEGESSPFARAW